MLADQYVAVTNAPQEVMMVTLKVMITTRKVMVSSQRHLETQVVVILMRVLREMDLLTAIPQVLRGTSHRILRLIQKPTVLELKIRTYSVTIVKTLDTFCLTARNDGRNTSPKTPKILRYS